MVVLSLAVAVFAYSTRCPCESSPRLPSSPLPPSSAPLPSPREEDKPYSERPLSNLHATVYVLSWSGDTSPPPAPMKLHFLLNSHPYTTYTGSVRPLFSAHDRVRLTLPKGGYTVRASFADGTQGADDSIPDGGMVVLSETEVRCRAMEAHVSAPDVPAGAFS